MSSRLFRVIREDRGLAYSISSSIKVLDDTGLMLIRAGLENAKIVDAISLIIHEVKKIRTNGINNNLVIKLFYPSVTNTEAYSFRDVVFTTLDNCKP